MIEHGKLKNLSEPNKKATLVAFLLGIKIIRSHTDCSLQIANCKLQTA
jgi:hypothetical protein